MPIRLPPEFGLRSAEPLKIGQKPIFPAPLCGAILGDPSIRSRRLALALKTICVLLACPIRGSGYGCGMKTLDSMKPARLRPRPLVSWRLSRLFRQCRSPAECGCGRLQAAQSQAPRDHPRGLGLARHVHPPDDHPAGNRRRQHQYARGSGLRRHYPRDGPRPRHHRCAMQPARHPCPRVRLSAPIRAAGRPIPRSLVSLRLTPTFLHCGAASIFAKVARDAAIAALGEVGSGYPSDPVTRAWLTGFIQRGEPFPSCVPDPVGHHR